MCGIFAVTNNPDAARLAFFGLFALQHRGQESAGLAVLDANGHIHCHRNRGHVAHFCKEEDLQALQGLHAIGHVRYSTAGGDATANIQPLFARIMGTDVSIAHNGNIVNADEIRQILEQEGSIFQGTADTEIILHLIARQSASDFGDRLSAILPRLSGAISLVILTPTHLYAVVDGLGYRPLSLGRIQTNHGISWSVSSETCAFDLVGAEPIRDILPGELVTIELATGKLNSRTIGTITAPQERKHCSFEHIYFGRPDSILWGKTSCEIRQAIGQALAEESPVAADCVVPIPDSGIAHAMGYAEGSGIPMRQGLIRNHYVGRTFIQPTQSLRNLAVRMKLNPVRELVKGKSLILVDDSLVRGTTSRKIIEILREAGAREIHLRLGSPPVMYPCFYGIDTPKRQDLLAQDMDIRQMKEYIGVDSLSFLSLDALKRVLSTCSGGFCVSCFSGQYQDTHAQERGHR